MSKLKSLRIPDSIFRDVKALADSKRITVTDCILRLIRAGLKDEEKSMQQKTTLAEIQEQQAFWDSKLLGIANDLGVDISDISDDDDLEELASSLPSWEDQLKELDDMLPDDDELEEIYRSIVGID